MDITINDTAQVSWKQVAVQKQERLRTGAEGETIKEMVETVMPTIYTKDGSKIEAQPLAPIKRVNINI